MVIRKGSFDPETSEAATLRSRIVALFDDKRPRTTQEAAVALDVSCETVVDRLRELKDAGWLRREAVTPRTAIWVGRAEVEAE